jgi:RNA polymerase sigma-70 factor (ECF subfamily)
MTSPEREAVFRRWFEEHLGLMLKVVRGCTATPQDQDDLLQDILLQLWSSIPSFRREAKETTWIYRVAFNTAMAWRRGERRRREGHESFVRFDLSPQVQSSHADALPAQEIVDRLYEAIRELPKVKASLGSVDIQAQIR